LLIHKSRHRAERARDMTAAHGGAVTREALSVSRAPQAGTIPRYVMNGPSFSPAGQSGPCRQNAMTAPPRQYRRK
jgi:hypothetical protein